MYMLCLDVGTTCSKAQVFDGDGNILFYRSLECPLTVIDGEQYADIVTIVSTVKSLIGEAAKNVHIDSVSFSSFGESFVLLDSDDNILTYPMLYTDSRGDSEAKKMGKTLGRERVFTIAGTIPNAMYSVSKLLWIKENKPEIYKRADKLLLICDYLGYIMSGKRVIDYGLAARSGVFDIRKKVFSEELLGELGISPSLFSHPMPTGSIVGNILPDVAKELGLGEDCLLILGSHDQVCATVGAGIVDDGEAADGMGTVECITAVYETPENSIEFGDMGYCVVPYPGDLYCSYILNFTSNSITNWFRKDIMHGYKGDLSDQFEYLEAAEEPSDLLLLPYFAGCCTPYQDTNAKGAILNITLSTTDRDIFRAILEGTSYEMAMNLDTVRPFGIDIRKMVATGGGSNSALWVQIKSDIMKVPIKTLRSAEGGLCGLAMLSAAALGICSDLHEARNRFVQYKNEYFPSDTYDAVYSEKYAKYKKIYNLLKEIY